MNRDRSVLRLALAALPLGLAAAAAAQTSNQTDAAAPALPIPAAPVITLPPAPAASPTPAAQRTPAARPTRAPAPRVTPTPRATARPLAATPTSTATPTPTPTASPTPLASPTPAPTPTVSASPVVTPASDLARTPAETQRVENPRWWAGVVVALLALAATAYLGWRWRQARRARRAEEEAARRPHVTVAGIVAPPPPPEVEGVPVGETGREEVSTFWTPSRPSATTGSSAAPAEPVAPPTRPRITMTLKPRRAGINLVSATADLELIVRNEGDGPAEEVAVGLRLLAGRAGQDDELGALFNAEPGRPVVPPFALPPGEERVCRTTLVLPRSEIEPIPIKNRPMFVPVVVADVRYLREDGGRGQTAAAYVVGAARAGSDKLAPFWLDTGSKMREDVEARPHGLAIES